MFSIGYPVKYIGPGSHHGMDAIVQDVDRINEEVKLFFSITDTDQPWVNYIFVVRID